MRVRLAFVAAIACGVGLAAAAERAAGWNTVISDVAREAPECVSWGAARIDCFARRPNGRLAWIAYTQGKWSAPQDLGGALPVGVSCVVRGPGGINCFAPSAKGVLAEIHLNGAKWSAWSSLGGDLAIGRASCVSLGPDHIACYARGRHGQLMSRAWDGGQSWNEWRNLGGGFSADPDCIVLSGARVACFGRGPDGQLVAYLPSEAAGPPAWMTYGGHVEGRPSCGAMRGFDITCAVRGNDGQLYVVRGAAVSGRATGKLVTTGDPAIGDPTCVSAGSDLTCFTQASQKRLLRRTFASNGSMSDGRVLNNATESAGVACLSIRSGALACLMGDSERRVQFAVGGELNGERLAGADGAGVDESPAGNWYLSSLETDALCRVRLFSDTNEGANRLERGSDCDDLPGVSRATRWQSDEDLLEFLTARGQVVARFRLTGSGRWISPGPHAPYLLSRDRPEGAPNESPDEPPPGLRFDEGDTRGVVGPWRLTALDTGESCGVRLTDWSAGGGNAVVLRGACRPEIRTVQFWSIEKNSVVLAAGEGRIVARFRRETPRSWLGENVLGTASYALTR